MNYIDKKFDFLKPIKNENLIRAGINKDGGYIVDSDLLKNTDCLLSLGMGDDWSFELDYLNKNEKGIINIYDHTINIFNFLKPFLKCLKRFLIFKKNFSDVRSRLNILNKYLSFIHNKRVKFFKQKISNNENSSKCISISKALGRLKEVEKLILKIDIEGSEYDSIDEIIKNNKKIEMIIIEFHDIDKKEDIFIKNVKNLMNDFDIIHLHGNNHCGLTSSGVPIALEITLMHKIYRPKEIVYEKNFPINGLDFPNNPLKNDINFSFK